MAKRKYTRRPVLSRFMEKVDTSGGPDSCWPWTGASIPQGYGTFWLDGKYKRANRVAWELFIGEIPEGFMVLHECDNPPCCNPKCLFLGDHKKNMEDMDSKGRRFSPGAPGEKNAKAKLNSMQVLEVLAKSKSGESAKQLAAFYEVTPGAVWRILSGGSWSHVTGIKKSV